MNRVSLDLRDSITSIVDLPFSFTFFHHVMVLVPKSRKVANCRIVPVTIYCIIFYLKRIHVEIFSGTLKAFFLYKMACLWSRLLKITQFMPLFRCHNFRSLTATTHTCCQTLHNPFPFLKLLIFYKNLKTFNISLRVSWLSVRVKRKCKQEINKGTQLKKGKKKQREE